jgi:hypothetical protein
VARDIDDDHRHARCREGLGDRVTDTGACTGHDADFAIETELGGLDGSDRLFRHAQPGESSRSSKLKVHSVR